jgi:hypothetical protein
MKYIVILLLIIVLIFLFNVKEPWKDRITPIEGKLSEPDLTNSDDIIDFILSKNEYTQQIKKDIVNNYKKKFKNLSELSKNLETVEDDINTQLKKIFIEEIRNSGNLDLVDFLTKEVKKNTDLIKGETGDKGEHGALTSNPDGEVLAKSLNIGANKTIDNNFINQFDNTIGGNNPIISKSKVYLGDIEKDDVITNALFTDNIFIGDKHIKSKNITDGNNNPISAIDFGNKLYLNTLKLGSNEIKEVDNQLKFNDLTSNVLDVNNLTVNNKKFKDIKQRGNKGGPGNRGLSPIGGRIYKDTEEIEAYNKGRAVETQRGGEIDFNFSDGTTKTVYFFGNPDYNPEEKKGEKGVKGVKGQPGIRGQNLTSGSFNKTTGNFTFNGREKSLIGSLPKGETGNKGAIGLSGPTGYSISPVDSSISGNTLTLINDNNEEKQPITLPILKGPKGVNGLDGTYGADFESRLLTKIIEKDNSFEFTSDTKLNKNLCFKTSDEKFCLNKKSFIDNFLRIRNVLNKLGVTINMNNINIPQLEYIIRLNADKLGYKSEDEFNINEVLEYIQNNETLDMLSKFNIKLNDMTLQEALDKVKYFKEILNIKMPIYDENSINSDFINELDGISNERKQILEKILLVDNLYDIDLPKSEINKRINDFFCKSKLMGYRPSSVQDGDCAWHYTSHANIDKEDCKQICVDRPGCNRYSYGTNLGCRVTQCGTNGGDTQCPQGQCPTSDTGSHNGKAYTLEKKVCPSDFKLDSFNDIKKHYDNIITGITPVEEAAAAAAALNPNLNLSDIFYTQNSFPNTGAIEIGILNSDDTERIKYTLHWDSSKGKTQIDTDLDEEIKPGEKAFIQSRNYPDPYPSGNGTIGFRRNGFLEKKYFNTRADTRAITRDYEDGKGVRRLVQTWWGDTIQLITTGMTDPGEHQGNPGGAGWYPEATVYVGTGSSVPTYTEVSSEQRLKFTAKNSGSQPRGFRFIWHEEKPK